MINESLINPVRVDVSMSNASVDYLRRDSPERTPKFDILSISSDSDSSFKHNKRKKQSTIRKDRRLNHLSKNNSFEEESPLHKEWDQSFGESITHFNVDDNPFDEEIDTPEMRCTQAIRTSKITRQ